MYQKFLEKKLSFLKNKPAAVNMSIIQDISNAEQSGNSTQDKLTNSNKVDECITNDRNNEEIKQETNEIDDKFIKRKLPYETKLKKQY